VASLGFVSEYSQINMGERLALMVENLGRRFITL
jgi:hypothetical protein